MNRKILATLAFILLVGFIHSQDKFEMGLKAGFNSTSFNTAEDVSFNNNTFNNVKSDFKSGYILGAWSRFHLLGSLSLQPELYYSKKSGHTEFKEGTEETLSYYSWDLPILANFTILDLEVFKLYGLAGPAISFRAKEKAEFSNPIIAPENDNSNLLKSTNWNLQLGAGIEVMRFSLDARYEWGINEISTHKDFERKTKALMFSLGYRLF